MSISSGRMAPLLILLIVGSLGTAVLPEVIEPGPDSGIILKDQPGLLITNCRLHTQRVFVRLNPAEACSKNLPITTLQTGRNGVRWTEEAISHAEADVTHMLRQLQKFTVTQSELNGFNKRPKRFIGGLLMAAATVGSLLSLGTSAVNAVNVATVKRQVGELQAEIPNIKTQLDKQQQHLQTIGQTLRGTVVVLNAHSVALNKTLQTVNSMLSVVQLDLAHIQLVNMLLSDMLQEISSSVDSLAMGRIPPYLVPLSLVQEILSTATREVVTDLQAHLAYTLGSAIPIYVDPQDRELAFIINLPIMAPENIYRLKDVVNVGFWQDSAYVRVKTTSLVAYQDDNPDLYLVPNLLMCTLTKDIHYLCPSKPFIRDSANGICGLKPMMSNTQCPVVVTPRRLVTSTQAEIVGNRWLVNTPFREALLTYDQHDTSERVLLPSQTFWVDVPVNAILHVGDLALYHLNPDQYESDIEISEFFSKHTIELDTKTLTRLEYEGTQVIDLTPIDNTLRELSSQPLWPVQPVTYAWSTPDTLLVTLVGLGYLLTFGIAWFYFKRTRALQSRLETWSNKMVKFVRHKRAQRGEAPSFRYEAEGHVEESALEAAFEQDLPLNN